MSCVERNLQGFRQMEQTPLLLDTGDDPFHCSGDGEIMAARPYQVISLAEVSQVGVTGRVVGKSQREEYHCLSWHGLWKNVHCCNAD